MSRYARLIVPWTIVIVMLVSIGTVAGVWWLQPRSEAEALCFWVQRQADGRANPLDKLSCRTQLARAAEEEAELEQQRQQQEQVEQRLEAARQQQAQREAEQRQQAERQADADFDACMADAQTRYGPAVEDLEQRWYDLLSFDADLTDEQYDAQSAELDRVSDELTQATDDLLAAEDACYDRRW